MGFEGGDDAVTEKMGGCARQLGGIEPHTGTVGMAINGRRHVDLAGSLQAPKEGSDGNRRGVSNFKA